ncbi:MAG: hypothetical protein H7343_11435 [Undibacterium sp.]|nr:hypothetical protein [Opitutaceae bacterium]
MKSPSSAAPLRAPSPALRPLANALAAALLLAALVATGAWMLFSNLALYDDEGYVLISARAYFAHGHLYESVYSQYGPAFYVMTDAFQHLLGAPVDHTSARWLTLGFWLGTAVCCAALVQRQTASRGLAAVTLPTTFLYLYFITDEPFHPGSLVIFILSLSLLVTTELLIAARLKIAVAVAGATGAVLLLTKINVGIFYLAAVGVWAGLHASPAHLRRLTGIVATGALVALATALMHTLWRETWVHIYLTLFACGAFALVRVLDREVFFRAPDTLLFTLAGAGIGAVILAAVWLRGTSLPGLLDGVLLGPLRHPGSYSYPVDWRPGALLVAGLSLALAFAHPWIRRRYSAAAADHVIVTLRIVLAAGLLVGFALLMQARVIGAIFTYVAPLIWIWVIPLSGVQLPRAVLAARGLVATVLLVQYLHAYPVGGSQESWGTFLFWPLAALGLGEIRLWAALPDNQFPKIRRWWPALATAVLILLVAKLAWSARSAHARYAARADLDLPGAAHVRLPESLRTAYPLLALNAAVHADLLFSLPGMFSFNLWTGLPTPTLKNTTLWFTLLNDGEQTAIIRAIEANPRTCIVVQESLVELMAAGRVPMRGLLHDYVKEHFVPAFRIEGFSFLMQNGRTLAPLGIARLGSARDGLETRVELSLASDETPIQRIEIRDVTAPLDAPPTQILDASNTQVALVAINRAGATAGAPAATAWPLRFKGLAHLSLRFDRGGVNLTPPTTAFYLIGADGKILGIARVGE